MRAQVGVQRSRFMTSRPAPDLKRALRLVPVFDRAVHEVSKLLQAAGIRHALVGTLGAMAYGSPPRTTADVEFLVGDEAFQQHSGGVVTMRAPVVQVDGIDIDQVPLTDALRVLEEALDRAPVGDGVPIAPIDTIVIMKLVAGRHQDLADVEAIVASGADRELLRAAVQRAAPQCADTLERLFGNVDRNR